MSLRSAQRFLVGQLAMHRNIQCCLRFPGSLADPDLETPSSHSRLHATQAKSKPDAVHTELIAPVTSSRDLQPSHRGQFYPFSEALVPEAFQQWHTDRPVRSKRPLNCDGGGSIPPLPRFNAGCKGLQYEFAQSRHPYVMFRPANFALWETLKSASSPVQRRVLLRGAPGCGKSVLLASTVEHLRQSGWIVMYIPDVNDITNCGQTYERNPETGMLDTREPAQKILRSVLEAHGEELKQHPQQVEGGSGSLFDLCNVTDAWTSASICNAVVRLKLELYRLKGPQVAIVVDNYNSLFWRTEYFDYDDRARSTARPIHAPELTVCANLKVLGEDVGNAVVVAALSTTGGVPDLKREQFSDEHAFSKFTMKPFTAAELGRWLLYYRYVEALAPAQPVTRKGVEAAHQLTQGDGTAARRDLHFLLPYDPALDDLDSIGLQYTNVALNS